MGNHCQCKPCHKCNDKEQEDSFHEDDERIKNIINNDQFEYKYNIKAIIGKEKNDKEDNSDDTIEYSSKEDENIMDIVKMNIVVNKKVFINFM